MYIVIYRPHGKLNCETKFYGPFAEHDMAYDYLGLLPPIGIKDNPDDNEGCKYIDRLTRPDWENGHDRT